MELFETILDLLKAALWPATVIWLVWFLKDKIQSFLIKFKDTEVQLSMREAEEKKAESDGIVNDVIQRLTPLLPKENMDEITKSLGQIQYLTDQLAALSTIERKGSNINGAFKFYKNGVVTLRIPIKPGQLTSGETQINFPAVLSSDDVNITFIGEEQPIVTKLQHHGMVLKLAQPNKEEINVIVHGLRTL